MTFGSPQAIGRAASPPPGRSPSPVQGGRVGLERGPGKASAYCRSRSMLGGLPPRPRCRRPPVDDQASLAELRAAATTVLDDFIRGPERPLAAFLNARARGAVGRFDRQGPAARRRVFSVKVLYFFNGLAGGGWLQWLGYRNSEHDQGGDAVTGTDVLRSLAHRAHRRQLAGHGL
jgi:hypothetical protein